jgi:hypothetical protein
MNLLKNILNRKIYGKLRFIYGHKLFKKNDWRSKYKILIIGNSLYKSGYNYYKLNNKYFCKKCNISLKKYIIDIFDFKDSYLPYRYNYMIDSYCINCLL